MNTSVIINLFFKPWFKQRLIWPLVHCSALNIGKNRCECCWNMNPDHELICWKTSDSTDNKYKHMYTSHPNTPSVWRCNLVGKTSFSLRSWGNSGTWRHIGVKPQREWITEVLVYYLYVSRRYTGHKMNGYKLDCCLSSKDTHVLSCSEDGHVYCWDLVEVSLSVHLCPHPTWKLFYEALMLVSSTGVFVLESASGESCCPVAVLPPYRDYPPHGHGETCPGLGHWARWDRGSDGQIEIVKSAPKPQTPQFHSK